MEIQAFVEQHLPPRPARVLEIGCGRGELAHQLANQGFDVVAIDPVAPDGAIFRRAALAEFSDPEPFDAVIAIRSLHHVPDLAGSVAKIGGLLRHGGRLLIYEHAWERLDDRTARWYREQLVAKGQDAPTLEHCQHDWRRDHHDLHTATAILQALERQVTQVHFAWAPYLYGELEPAVTAEHEQSLIDAGQIAATGFTFVGERSN